MPPLYAMPLNNDTVSPGVLGFVVFLALLVATALLIRSMTKHMKKIQAPSEEELKQQEWDRAQEAKSGAAAKSPADDA
jgi:flagellar biosynthesis/type III secretory pathway M-ring protein FliF/YscJ